MESYQRVTKTYIIIYLLLLFIVIVLFTKIMEIHKKIHADEVVGK